MEGGRSVAVKAGEVLGSLKLTLALLAALVLLGAAGTLVPAWGGERLFRGPVFLGIFALLCANILYCTWRRFARRRAGGRGGLLAWADLAAHLSVLVILAGGAGKAVWGFLGTQYLFVDTPVGRVFDPAAGVEVPLGTTLLLKRIEEDHYPLHARFGLEDPATGARSRLVEVVEGREAAFPGRDLRLRIAGHDREAGWLKLEVEREGRRSQLEFSLLPDGAHSAELGPDRLVFQAWRQELKGVRGLVAVSGDSGPPAEGWLAVNSRVAHGGTSLFLTGWGKDDHGRRFLTIQVSRDPFAPLFWAGCVLFSLAAPLFLALRRRPRGRSSRL